MLIVAMMMMQPVLDFTWIEDAARLQGEWERCVLTNADNFDHGKEMPETIAAAAMLACGTRRSALEERMRQSLWDQTEIAIRMAGAESEIRRRAIRHVKIQRVSED